MIYDLQKANFLKRISAWLLDFILVLTLAVGVVGGLSAILGYDAYVEEMDGYYAQYEKEYGVVFDITEEQFNAMTKEEQDNYDAAYKALIADKGARHTYDMIANLAMVMATLGILIAFLILEFFVPMALRNGQTLGKKVFGIAVMRTNGVRINGVCLFIRAVLGKYAVETMIPVFILMMLLFGMVGFNGTLVIFGLAAIQLALLIATQTNAMIHDKLADTVVVDMSSQMIFDTEEDLLAYKKRVAAERAAKDPYA